MLSCSLYQAYRFLQDLFAARRKLFHQLAKRGVVVDIITMKALSISNIHLGLPDILILVLLIFFGMRFIKGRKFMPGGLMTIASLLALILRQVLS